MEKDEKSEIKTLIEKLTHSGNDTLNPGQLKRIHSISSESVKNAEIILNHLIKLLEKKHSEVRFSAVQLCDELFMHSDIFRKLFIHKLLILLKYTIEEPLPPPKPAAKKLKKLLITCIDKWYNKFGNSEDRLKTLHHYLKTKKNVDFETKEIIDPKKKLEEEEKERKATLLCKEYLKKINAEMEEMTAEIQATTTSLETCFTLLLPTPEEFNGEDISSVKDLDTTCNNMQMRLFGVINPQHTVQIQFDKDAQIEVSETEENKAILEAAKEAFSLINNRFLPKTKAWVELLCKVKDDNLGCCEHIKQNALEQEQRLDRLVMKYKQLKIIKSSKEVIDDLSSDSDLEEVVLPKPNKAKRQLEEISFLSETLGMAAMEDSHINVAGNEKSEDSNEKKIDKRKIDDSQFTERKKKLLEIAPKLPYDIDLYHWEDEKLPTPTILPVNFEGARFWSSAASSDDIPELPVPGGSSTLRTRVIEFSGKFEPVTRACRFPLPSGKLCPRKDRIKCPFHGLIVDRDEKGSIVNEEDQAKIKCQPTKPIIPDWQDPKLLAEIKAATGVDCKMPEKGRKKKTVKHPGLTDLNAGKKTPKARIKKKIFNKASLRRIAAVMNNLEFRRHRDKFGDQFNYVHNN